MAASNPDSPHSAFLAFVAETVGAAGWIVVERRPAVFIRESYDGGKRHVREIKKGKNKAGSSSMAALHAEWIRAWQEVILDLEAFVREWHPYGLVWGKG